MTKDLKHIEYICIFNYGGLLAMIIPSKKELKIITKFTEKELTRAASIIAIILRKMEKSKGVSIMGNHIFIFGENYIIVAAIKKKDFQKHTELLQKLLKDLDKFPVISTEDLRRIVKKYLK